MSSPHKSPATPISICSIAGELKAGLKTQKFEVPVVREKADAGGVLRASSADARA
jgi:hypothetical protein